MLPDAHPPHPPPNMTTEVCLCHKSCQYDYVQSRMPDVNISCSRHLLLPSETGTDAQCGERGRRNRWGRACSLAPVCAIAALAAWTCRPVRATQASAVLRGQADWELSNQAAICRASLRNRQTCNQAWNQVLLMRSQADSSPQARHRAHARWPQTQKNSRCRVLRLALCPLSRGPSRAVLAGPCSVRTAQHPSSPWSERRPNTRLALDVLTLAAHARGLRLGHRGRLARRGRRRCQFLQCAACGRQYLMRHRRQQAYFLHTQSKRTENSNQNHACALAAPQGATLAGRPHRLCGRGARLDARVGARAVALPRGQRGRQPHLRVLHAPLRAAPLGALRGQRAAELRGRALRGRQLARQLARVRARLGLLQAQAAPCCL